MTADFLRFNLGASERLETHWRAMQKWKTASPENLISTLANVKEVGCIWTKKKCCDLERLRQSESFPQATFIALWKRVKLALTGVTRSNLMCNSWALQWSGQCRFDQPGRSCSTPIAKTEREHARESITARPIRTAFFALQNFTRKRFKTGEGAAWEISPAKKPPSTGSASLASGEMQCARDANEEKVVRRALCVCALLLQVQLSRGPLLLRQQNYINTNRCRNGSSTSLFNFPAASISSQIPRVISLPPAPRQCAFAFSHSDNCVF